VIDATFTLAGGVDGFDQTNLISRLLQTYPIATSVRIVSVQSASVLVTVEIVFATADDANAVHTALSTSAAADLSVALGVTVESTSVEPVSSRYVANLGTGAPPSPSSAPASILAVTAVGFSVGAAVLVLGVVFVVCQRRRGPRGQSAYTEHVTETTLAEMGYDTANTRGTDSSAEQKGQLMTNRM